MPGGQRQGFNFPVRAQAGRQLQGVTGLLRQVVQLSGASTYAIYKVFIQHFESGGTFLDLDPSKVKSYFSEQFTKGKAVAADLKKDETASTAN